MYVHLSRIVGTNTAVRGEGRGCTCQIFQEAEWRFQNGFHTKPTSCRLPVVTATIEGFHGGHVGGLKQ